MMPRFAAPVRRLALALAAAAAIAVPAAAQTLTVGVRGGPESMDPHFTALGTNIEAMKHVFDALVTADENLQVQPGLAESWRPVDATTWEFKLRRGVRFHDGSELTAEDVRFSFARIPDITGPNPVTIYSRRVREVRVVDPLTVHLVTDGPAPTLPNDIVRVFIVSARAAAGLNRDTANEAFNSGRAAIGTGPYRFVSWTPREEMVVERFDGYWGGRPAWARVVRREILNDAARIAQLRARQVDMISRVPATDIPGLRREARLDAPMRETIYNFLLDFDLREQSPQISGRNGAPLPANPFRDPRVREAIDLAIDRRALAEVAQEGMGAPATQLVTPGIFGFNPAITETRENLARARTLMREAGYPDGFRFTLSFTADRFPGDREVGTSIVQMLARIGLEVTPSAVPVAVLFAARPRGELSATMAGWGTGTGEAYYTYSLIAHSNDTAQRLGAFNWRQYVNPELDRLIEAAGVELDAAKREDMLKRAAVLFAADRVTLPITSIGTAWAGWRDRVRFLRLRADEETLAMDVAPVQ